MITLYHGSNIVIESVDLERCSPNKDFGQGFYLTDIEEQELKAYFPEFRRYEEQCRFQGCRHIHEPDCGVKAALAEHEISQLRYEDYLGLYNELKEKRRY